MSGFGDLTSGSAFYSDPVVQPIDQPRLRETGDIDRANSLPEDAAAPPFVRYQDSGADSFAPSPMTKDASFQPAIPGPEVTGPPLPIIPLLAGGLFLLWLAMREK